jgi:hypothetical protein
MGIALRDQSGNLRRSEYLLADVADAFARIFCWKKRRSGPTSCRRRARW